MNGWAIARDSHDHLPLAKDFDVVGGSVPNSGDEDKDDVDARPLVRHEQEGRRQHCGLLEQNTITVDI